jgi:hypothetical protein
MTMRRSVALQVEARALDEIAVLSKDYDTLNLLLVYFSQHPVLLPRLIDMRRRTKERLELAQARRNAASEHI